MTGAEGCGNIAEEGIQKQFFSILGQIVQILKHESLEGDTTKYIHLINALCWNFTIADHEELVKVEVFKTLCRGNGDILHPLFRAWGQDESNFSLELDKKTNFSLSSRVRQVFEFLTQNLLEGIFVKKELESIDLGQETKMLVKQDSVNQDATDTLLGRICDILFTNVQRYITMKKVASKEESLAVNSQKRMFSELIGENDQADSMKFPHDIASYINRHGGKQVVFGRMKINGVLNH